MRDLHGGRVFLAFNELRDELHRAWAIECNQRDDFLERTQPDLTAELLHAAGL